MKVEGEYKFAASQTQVWAIFTDPRSLEKTIPGCESLKEYEPGKYDATLKIGVPSVKGTYTGKFELLDAVPPQQCRLVGEGSGTPGFVKADTRIVLTTAEGGTVLKYQGDLQVGGLISGVGQRMIGGITKMMLKQFFKKVSSELGVEDATPESASDMPEQVPQEVTQPAAQPPAAGAAPESQPQAPQVTEGPQS